MATPNRGKGKAIEPAKYLPQNDPPDPAKAPKRKLKRKEQKETDNSNVKPKELEDDIPLPGPKGAGDMVKRVNLEANYFTVTTSNANQLHLYNLSFCAGYEPGSRRRERRVIQLMMDKYDALRCAATDYKQSIVSKNFLTENQSSTALGIDYYEHGDQAPQTGNPGNDTYWVQIDYKKSLSLTNFNHYLLNAAACPPYGMKEETVEALNTLLGRFPNQTNHIPAPSKNRIFDTSTPNASRNRLGGGLEAYLGFEKSARTSAAGLLVNVNALTSAFYREVLVSDLIDDWSAHWSKSTQDNMKKNYAHRNVSVLETFLKGVRVRATYEPRRFYSIWKIPRIVPANRPLPGLVIFNWQKRHEDGSVEPPRPITVHDYFKEQYNGVNPLSDAIVVDVGSDQHPIYIPSNLLRVLPGNRYCRALDDRQQTPMITSACRPAFRDDTDTNRRRSNKLIILGTGLPLLGIAPPAYSLNLEQELGIRVSHKMLQFDGNQLDAPRLQYRPTNPQFPRHIEQKAAKNGSWNLQNLLFNKPGRGERWSWMEISIKGRKCTKDQRKNFLRSMGEHLRSNCSFQEPAVPLGWHCPNCHHDPHSDMPSCHFFYCDGYVNKIALSKAFKHFKDQRVSILFVILPDKQPATYAAVKYVADVEVGIRTTCVVRYPNWRTGLKDKYGKPIRELKCDPGTAINILHKVNLRLGGENVILDSHAQQEGQLFSRETIVLGADVTHPGVGSQKGCPSVAAVVGSIEPEFNLYSASIRCQEGKVESIQNFGDMVGERIDLWKDRNAFRYKTGQPRYPKQIVIFRDGVSESQFQMVLKSEWPQIRGTIASRYERIKQDLPKVLLICVLKRHSTRFFPTKQGDRDLNGNPRCGLVVDDNVTYENAYDFYLQSHACIQGTARSAHYVVLVDEIDLPRSVVQKEVFHHCFLFGRCSKAIGIHPAARYADRACDRARSYHYDAFTGGHNPNQGFTQNMQVNRVHADLVDDMFFV